MRALAAALVVAGCGGGSGAPDAMPPDASPPASGVDILFVMDDTASMDYRQEELAADFPGFLAALESALGTLPDLHIGVISTDMGAADYGIHACDSSADGVLQTTARISGCTPPPRPWIQNGDDIAGALSCIVQLGVGGCGFEQPLAALQRALTNPANDGFRVDGHALAIMILTDEDDCSAIDPTVFDPDDLDTWGPLSSFRCFEHGVVCDPDAPRTSGDKLDCRPRDGVMLDPADVADALLADTPAGWLAVSIFAGDRDPVAVAPDPERPTEARMVPSCRSPSTGYADPGIRLGAFLDRLVPHLGPRASYSSICSDDLAPPLAAFAAQIAAMLD
jgi:hypothetical protein